MSQRLLFLALLVAYLFSGVFEVVDNLLGLREFNFDSSAPFAAKVAKELAIFLILGTLALRHRREGRFRPVDLMIATSITALMVVPTLWQPGVAAARVGYFYLVASIAVLWVASKVAPFVDLQALDRWFLIPAIVLICLSQGIEIYYSPVSLYNESSLLGLDRRAGLAVIPTTAGCLGALAVHRLRGWWRVPALLVVVLANSSIGWACLLLLLVAKVKRKSRLLLAAPFALGALILLISTRQGFTESSTTRLELFSESWQQLHILTPSAIGSFATAKSVALDPGASFVADASALEFFHVFGVIPGALLLLICALIVWRATGLLGVIVFLIASSGFLLLEAWIVSVLLVFLLARPRAAIAAEAPRRDPSRRHTAPLTPTTP